MDITELGVSIKEPIIETKDVKPSVSEVQQPIQQITIPEKKVSFDETIKEIPEIKEIKEIPKEIKEISKEIKEIPKEQPKIPINKEKENQPENVIISFIKNNLQTFIFTIIMIVFCIYFHYYNKKQSIPRSPSKVNISRPFNVMKN